MVKAIRRAFAAGEFGRAQRLWREYALQLQSKIEAGTATPEMMSEMRQLIDWASLVAKVHKAHAAHQLKGLHLAGRYQVSPPAPPAGRIRVSL